VIRLIVCDLDGTLYDHEQRVHLAKAKKWDEYHANSLDDRPNPLVADLLHAMQHRCSIVFLTGRDALYEDHTHEWIDLNLSLDDYHLIMRPKGDFTPDVELKSQLFAEWLGDNPGYYQHEILFLEDRDRVVEMWRNAGYQCWQVQPGDF
jgi:hydroxymethylpyrimidine pyrophosphatase-like HAD family hydrolase